MERQAKREVRELSIRFCNKLMINTTLTTERLTRLPNSINARIEGAIADQVPGRIPVATLGCRLTGLQGLQDLMSLICIILE